MTTNAFTGVLPRFVVEGENHLRVWDIYLDVARRHQGEYDLNAIVLEMHAKLGHLTVVFCNRQMAEKCEDLFRAAWKRIGGTHYSAMYPVRLSDKTRIG